jgi:hypothetical protein
MHDIKDDKMLSPSRKLDCIVCSRVCRAGANVLFWSNTSARYFLNGVYKIKNSRKVKSYKDEVILGS